MGNPTCMYRRGAFGRVFSRIFDSDDIPPGWVDTPAKLPAADAPARKKAPKNAKAGVRRTDAPARDNGQARRAARPIGANRGRL